MASLLLWIGAGTLAGVAGGCWALLALADINPTVQPTAVTGLLGWLALGYGVAGAVGGALLGFAVRLLPSASAFRSVALAVCGACGIAAIALAVAPLRELAQPPEPNDGAVVTAREAPGQRVLLLGLDGLDWRMIDTLIAEGELPAFAALIDNGSRAPLRTFEPTWSPLIWNTIATGTPPEAHGILDFGQLDLPGVDCGPQRLLKQPVLAPLHIGLNALVTFARDVGVAHETPVSSCHRRMHAVWNHLDRAGLRVAVLNWFASHPAERVNGFVLSDNNPYRAAFLETRHDGFEHTDARITVPRDLLARLGRIEIDLPPEEPIEAVLDHRVFSEYSDADRAAAASPHARELLPVARLIIATDLFVSKSTALLLREERPDFTAAYLSGADNISHRFGKKPGVARQYYRFLDTMVAEMVEAAGPETTVAVVSDHGWSYEADDFGHYHAPDGIFLLSGPAARKGVALEAKPGIHDIAPTLLALFGIPPSRHFTGRTVHEAFDTPHADLPAVDYGLYRAPEVGRDDRPKGALEGETMKKLRALGYVE